MNLIEAIILGIVQGLTEFLPISSSGHLALMEEALGFSQESSTIEFDLLLHFSTLLAVILYFRKRLISLFLSVFRTGDTDEKKLITFLEKESVDVDRTNNALKKKASTPLKQKVKFKTVLSRPHITIKDLTANKNLSVYLKKEKNYSTI